MRFEVAAVAAFVAVANAAVQGGNDTVVYETLTTTALTTYCPESTTFVHGTKTYTVTTVSILWILFCFLLYMKLT
jgi:hypothetical protein